MSNFFTLDINKRNLDLVIKSMSSIPIDSELVIVRERFGEDGTMKSRILTGSSAIPLNTTDNIASTLYVLINEEFNKEDSSFSIIMNESNNTMKLCKTFNDGRFTMLSLLTISKQGSKILSKTPAMLNDGITVSLLMYDGINDLETFTSLSSGNLEKDLFKVKTVAFELNELKTNLEKDSYKFRLINKHLNSAIYTFYTDKDGEVIGMASIVESQEEVLNRLYEAIPRLKKDKSFKLFMFANKLEWKEKADELGLLITDDSAPKGHYLERVLEIKPELNEEDIVDDEDIYDEDEYYEEDESELEDELDEDDTESTEDIDSEEDEEESSEEDEDDDLDHSSTESTEDIDSEEDEEESSNSTVSNGSDHSDTVVIEGIDTEEDESKPSSSTDGDDLDHSSTESTEGITPEVDQDKSSEEDKADSMDHTDEEPKVIITPESDDTSHGDEHHDEEHDIEVEDSDGNIETVEADLGDTSDQPVPDKDKSSDIGESDTIDHTDGEPKETITPEENKEGKPDAE